MSLPAIELYDPDVYAAGVPHEQVRWLRANAPVYWHQHPAGGGYWVLSRHADVLAVSRDHRSFSAETRFRDGGRLRPTSCDTRATSCWAWTRRATARCAAP